MININDIRQLYILYPTVPSGTTDISYTVSIGGNLVFLGKTKYFGDFEIDTRDWFDSYLYSMKYNTLVNELTMTVVLTYTGVNSNGAFTSTATMTKRYTPYDINLPYLIYNQDGAFAYINIWGNCGFLMTRPDNQNKVAPHIPLSVKNGMLEGKTINKLDKITYMDKYGNTRTGSITNQYELECFVDPCWLQVETGDDLEYEKVMLALQNFTYGTLVVSSNVKISGMDTHYHTGQISFVHVKDVEKIETYSSYSTDKKVPTLKITLEIDK